MVFLFLCIIAATTALLPVTSVPENVPPLPHSNNWAVLACTSSYWFNYRHVSNVLSIYYIIRSMGIPDSHIILMNAMDPACDTRNPFPGSLYNTLEMDTALNQLKDVPRNRSRKQDKSVEVDYRGDEVSVDSFLRLLTGRHHPGTPASKILQSGNDSNVLIFLTGHGGDGFFKFRDKEELSAEDIGMAFEEMELKGKYKELLFIIDTCQASTLANKMSAPRVVTIGSSGLGENSYAYLTMPELGLSVIDRFTYSVSEFFYEKAGIISGNPTPTNAGRRKSTSQSRSRRGSLSYLTLQHLLDWMNPQFMFSTATVSLSPSSRNPKDILLSDFFGWPSMKATVVEVPLETSTISGSDETSAANWDIEYSSQDIYSFDSSSTSMVEKQNRISDISSLPSNTPSAMEFEEDAIPQSAHPSIGYDPEQNAPLFTVAFFILVFYLLHLMFDFTFPVILQKA
jgi:glycosylphosphatidylinositol transamidase (GPIT) subunit GPI8